MSVQDLYRKTRLATAEDALSLLRNGDFIIIPTGVGEPPTLLHALSAARRQFHDIKLGQILAVRKYGYFDPETVEHVRHVAFFYGAASRAGGKEGWVDFIPNYFAELPSADRARPDPPPTWCFTMASPMDEHGYFSPSPSAADYTMAAVKKARAIDPRSEPQRALRLRRLLPCTSPRSAPWWKAATRWLEVGLPTIGPVQEAIGKYVADLIEDGSTLQIGYGGIPRRRGDAAPAPSTTWASTPR